MAVTTEGTVSHYTKLINVLTDEYNLTLTDIKRRHRNVMWSTPVREESIYEMGYAVIQPRSSGTEGEYYEVTPENIEGIYYQTWALRDPDPAADAAKLTTAKNEAVAQMERMVDEALARGVAFNFGTEEVPNVQHVQMRGEDRTNILGMSVKAEREPTLTQYFRTRENNMVAISADTVITMSNAQYSGFIAVKSAQWTYADLVSSATTIETIPAVPVGLEDFYINFASLVWA